MNASVSILLLDGEPLLRRATALLLSNHGGSVMAAATPDEAVALAAERLYDVAILDVEAVRAASEVARRIRAAGLVPRRLIAVCDTDDVRDQAEFVAVLQKPYAFERLVAAVFGGEGRGRARTLAHARARATASRSRPRTWSPRRAARAARDRG